jgi:hypothetical protein
MKTQIFSDQTPVSPALIRELANAGTLDEISNGAGSVRRYIFHFGMRDMNTGRTQKALLFAIYQTGRHGPQNGYRLCLVHQGLHIAAPDKKEGEPEDELDLLEKDIPQGHEEIVILGEDMFPLEPDTP